MSIGYLGGEMVAGLINSTKMLKGTSKSIGPVPKKVGKTEGASKTVDPLTGNEVGRFISDGKGNVMIEPVGGKTVPAGRGGVDTHTTYPNGSNYQRLNPQGYPKNPTPHGHGHLEGSGQGMRGQGTSIDLNGNEVEMWSPLAHWYIYK